MQPHRVSIVLLHELLDGEQMRPVGEAQMCGQPDLLIERENFLRHAGPSVEERADAQQKFFRLLDRAIIGLGENPAIGQFTNRRGMEARSPDPLQEMEIPQPAFAFFDVRLQKVDCFTELLVLALPLGHLLVEVGIESVRHDFPDIPRMKLLEQVGAAGQEAGLHHRRPDRQIGEAQIHTVLNSPYAMADLESAVPQRVEHLLDQLRHHLRGVRVKQKHQVDIGVRRQFPPAIPADRHQATMLKASRRERLAAGSRRSPVAADDQSIDHVGGRRDHLVARGAREQPLPDRLSLLDQQLGYRRGGRVLGCMRIRIHSVRHT